MKMVRASAIFLILMMVNVHQGSAFFSDIWTVIKYSYDVSSKILEGESAYGLLTDDTGQKLDNIYSSVQKIMRDQQSIANRLEANVQKMINNLRNKLRNDIEFDRLKEKLTQDYIGRVNNVHKTFIDAIQRNYNNITMCDLATRTTSFGSNEIHDSLGKTSQLIITEGMSSYFSNFIDILLEHTQGETAERCGIGKSQQQEVYQLYELLVETEKKAFTVLSLAYSFKSRCLKANFNNEIKGVQTDMIKRVIQYMETIKKAMAKVSTEIRRCEPTEYIRNENFVELERYLRLIILPENETSAKYSCFSTCGSYNKSVAPFYGSEVSGRHEILAQNCQWCESSGYTKICYPKDAESSRYYHGIVATLPNQAPYQEYGHFSECNKRDNKTYTEIHNSYLYHLDSKCDICACKCLNYEKNLKWLYSINLRPQVADIANNMIVTGIRFRHRSTEHTGHVIYPEIKVGKLLPYGEVTDGKWQIVEGPDYTFQHMNYDNHDQYVSFGERPEEARYVNLDDAYANPGQVVTGVKFILFNDPWRMKRPWYITLNDTGRSVGLAIKMTPFNFTTGKLNTDEVHTTYSQPDLHIDVPEISPNIYRLPGRQEVYLEGLDVPTKSKNTKPNSEDRNYLRFTMSDKFKDFGQTTVPFIDIQPVETSPPSPLSGIGLFFKNEPGYGGFLAFKLMTLNMTDVIKTDIPEAEKIKLGL